MLAATLGANRADEPEEGAPSDWNRRRAEALARGEPEPQWDDFEPTAAEKASMEALMRRMP